MSIKAKSYPRGQIWEQYNSDLLFSWDLTGMPSKYFAKKYTSQISWERKEKKPMQSIWRQFELVSEQNILPPLPLISCMILALPWTPFCFHFCIHKMEIVIPISPNSQDCCEDQIIYIKALCKCLLPSCGLMTLRRGATKERGLCPRPFLYSRLTCNFEGTLGCVSDGGSDSHWWGLAFLQGTRVSQADRLFQLSNLGWIITAFGPFPPPLRSPRFHLQAATVVLQLFGGLLLWFTKPAQPTFCQRALLWVCAKLKKRTEKAEWDTHLRVEKRRSGVGGWGVILVTGRPCSLHSIVNPGFWPTSLVLQRKDILCVSGILFLLWLEELLHVSLHAGIGTNTGAKTTGHILGDCLVASGFLWTALRGLGPNPMEWVSVCANVYPGIAVRPVVHLEIAAQVSVSTRTTIVEFLREAVGVVGRELREELALNSSELRLSEASLSPLLMELLSSQLQDRRPRWAVKTEAKATNTLFILMEEMAVFQYRDWPRVESLRLVLGLPVTWSILWRCSLRKALCLYLAKEDAIISLTERYTVKT